MRLLVSVRRAEEALAALAGGADIVDAKEPDAGALGAVSIDDLRAIVAAVRGATLVTAALGDAADAAAVERDAAAFVEAGAGLVKVGLSGIPDRERASTLLAAAARGAGPHRVIAVAYGDYAGVNAVAPVDILALAAREGLAGVLLDTADKSGPGLAALVPPASLAQWVRSARRAGLLVALAGRITLEQLDSMQATGADIVGVRGAACEGGRGGEVAAARVRLLKEAATGQRATASQMP
jgi:(5-formylfuran-3-yl)methyl phosphate synthase